MMGDWRKSFHYLKATPNLHLCLLLSVNRKRQALHQTNRKENAGDLICLPHEHVKGNPWKAFGITNLIKLNQTPASEKWNERNAKKTYFRMENVYFYVNGNYMKMWKRKNTIIRKHIVPSKTITRTGYGTGRMV